MNAQIHGVTPRRAVDPERDGSRQPDDGEPHSTAVGDARAERPPVELVERVRGHPHRQEERARSSRATTRRARLGGERRADRDVGQVPQRVRRVEQASSSRASRPGTARRRPGVVRASVRPRGPPFTPPRSRRRRPATSREFARGARRPPATSAPAPGSGRRSIEPIDARAEEPRRCGATPARPPRPTHGQDAARVGAPPDPQQRLARARGTPATRACRPDGGRARARASSPRGSSTYRSR